MSKSVSGGPVAPQPAAANPTSSRWLVPLAILVVICGGALIFWATAPGRPVVVTPSTTGQPAPPASVSSAKQNASLHVFVRPPVRATEPVPIDEPGARPVRPGWIMSLQSTLDAPAHTYFLWLDATGQAVPLYPWNPQTLEITDINEPPPPRSPAKTVYSPLLGGGWTFGETTGIQTVILLARATPLPEGTSVGKLLGDLPPSAAVRDPQELLILEVRDHAKTVAIVTSKNRGDEKEAAKADEPLKALLLRLSPHFDLVRAVRFAHVASEEPDGGAASPAPANASSP